MQRVRIAGLVALAVLALSAIMATVAQAEGPFYQLCKKVGAGLEGNYKDSLCTEKVKTKEGFELNRLINPASKEIEVEATDYSGKGVEKEKKGNTNFELEVTGIKIVCEKLKLKNGTIKGSEKGNAGTSSETLEFSGCTVTGDGEACKVPGGKITTEEVINTLATETGKNVEKEHLLVSFAPAKPPVFVKIKFEGTCKLAETTIELGGTAKLGVAGIADNGNQVPIELGVAATEILALNNLIEFPRTPIKEVFVENNKVISKVEEKLTAFAKSVVKFAGHANIKLIGSTKGEAWGVFGRERP